MCLYNVLSGHEDRSCLLVCRGKLSRGLLNKLSLNIICKIDYVMIGLADRGHPFNLIDPGWRINLLVKYQGSCLHGCACILITWDRHCSCVISMS